MCDCQGVCSLKNKCDMFATELVVIQSMTIKKIYFKCQILYMAVFVK